MIRAEASRVIELWSELKRELVADGGRDGAAEWLADAAKFARAEADIEHKRRRASVRLAWTTKEQKT